MIEDKVIRGITYAFIFTSMVTLVIWWLILRNAKRKVRIGAILSDQFIIHVRHQYFLKMNKMINITITVMLWTGLTSTLYYYSNLLYDDFNAVQSMDLRLRKKWYQDRLERGGGDYYVVEFLNKTTNCGWIIYWAFSNVSLTLQSALSTPYCPQIHRVSMRQHSRVPGGVKCPCLGVNFDI